MSMIAWPGGGVAMSLVVSPRVSGLHAASFREVPTLDGQFSVRAPP
jgi:hypothetical protein